MPLRAGSGLDGRTPFEAAAGQPVRRIENERGLDILLAPRPGGDAFRKVVKGAVKVDGGTYFAAELGPFGGFDVEVRLDPDDLGIVYVMAGDGIPKGLEFEPGEFVCRAENAARLGTDRAEVAARAPGARYRITLDGARAQVRIEDPGAPTR